MKFHQDIFIWTICNHFVSTVCIEIIFFLKKGKLQRKQNDISQEKKAAKWEVHVLKEEVSRYGSTLTMRFVNSVGF